MFKLATLVVITLCGLSSANTSEQQSTTDTTNLNTTKSGEKNVAASGQLDPFGEIGVGCGINWKENRSYGGGLQAGSNVFGLGGGFTIKPDSFEIGAGVGIKSANQSASIQFSGSTNGTFEIVFESSQNFACTPGAKDGKYNIRCTTI